MSSKTSIPFPVYPTGVPGWWHQYPPETVVNAPLLLARTVEDDKCINGTCTINYTTWSNNMTQLYNAFIGNPKCKALERNGWCSFHLASFEIDCWKDFKQCHFHLDPKGMTSQMTCNDAPANINDCNFSYRDGHTENIDCDKKKDICTVTSGGSALVKGVLQNPTYWLTVVVLAVSAF